ncbi:MAG: hypothetical protein WC076_09780 [Terrimicrobiaceae bacterium]|jgi:hypothetical protein|nr:hypothetical protein [Terrimicrobiaceae bacterium]
MKPKRPTKAIQPAKPGFDELRQQLLLSSHEDETASFWLAAALEGTPNPSRDNTPGWKSCAGFSAWHSCRCLSRSTPSALCWSEAATSFLAGPVA